jgi:transposase
MSKPLSDSEIKQRLLRLSNLERLHTRDRKRITTLKAENKQLKLLLHEQKTYFEAIVEAQNARITELETMVFGRKPKSGTPITSPPSLASLPAKPPRAPQSYRRPLPPAAAITDEEHHGTTDCHRCGHNLTDKEEAVRYQEDIVLAALTPDIPHTTVTKQTIERGWCSRCGQWSSAKDLRGQVVTIGPVVRSLITYLVVQADQTYAQTQDLLWQLYRFTVTSGEMAAILAARREVYLPQYEQLKQTVRAGPSHMDETSCPIQSERGAGYAHVMVGADGTNAEHVAVFSLADSRGKGVSQALVGQHYDQVGVTDRYSAYKHLFVLGCHQICWAHLHRNARDLTHLECLSEPKQKHVTTYYKALAAIYADTREYHGEAFDERKRKQQAAALLERVMQLCVPHALDPAKLARLKAGILDYHACLFVCLTTPGVPVDNNKAERALRKLVIKRKKSFGVKTMKGARTMEVLLSVCYSLYHQDKDNFLPALHTLATAPR